MFQTVKSGWDCHESGRAGISGLTIRLLEMGQRNPKRTMMSFVNEMKAGLTSPVSHRWPAQFSYQFLTSDVKG